MVVSTFREFSSCCVVRGFTCMISVVAILIRSRSKWGDTIGRGGLGAGCRASRVGSCDRNHGFRAGSQNLVPLASGGRQAGRIGWWAGWKLYTKAASCGGQNSSFDVCLAVVTFCTGTGLPIRYTGIPTRSPPGGGPVQKVGHTLVLVRVAVAALCVLLCVTGCRAGVAV